MNIVQCHSNVFMNVAIYNIIILCYVLTFLLLTNIGLIDVNQ